MIFSLKTEKNDIGFDFDIALEKEQKLYCFIGKNSIGKTQLLEHMAKALIFSHSIFHAKDERYIYSNKFRQKIVYDTLKDTTLKLPLGLSVNGLNIKNETMHPWGYTNFEHLQGFQNNGFICDKPLVFIGAKNRGFTKNIDTHNIKILGDTLERFVESFQRTLTYLNSEGLEHEEIANWFTSRLIVNPSFVVNNQNKSNEVITVLRLIEKLEPNVQLVHPNETGGYSLKVLFHEGRLWVNNIPLDKLSTGFVSIIKIFQEIVAGYGGWTSAEDLSKVEGIVFIDEIEPHLHISWQTKIIQILKESFPKTTFYISTHSPLVLAGLKNKEAYELYKEENSVKTRTIESLESYFLNDIVKEFFDVDLNESKVLDSDKEQHKKTKDLLEKLLTTLQEQEK